MLSGKRKQVPVSIEDWNLALIPHCQVWGDGDESSSQTSNNTGGAQSWRMPGPQQLSLDVPPL